jgi:hypothetical protein
MFPLDRIKLHIPTLSPTVKLTYWTMAPSHYTLILSSTTRHIYQATSSSCLIHIDD